MNPSRIWCFLLQTFILFSFGGVKGIDNNVPDINDLKEPARGTERTAEDDEMWCTPEQVHISFGNSTYEMAVMWATRGHCDTQVQYAAHPWKLNSKVSGTSIELEQAKERSLKYVHRAVLKNLAPSTTYFFRPVMKSGVGAGPFYFMTPAVHNDSQPWVSKFLVSSNLNLDSTVLKPVIDEALSGTYSALLYNGDLEKNLTPETGIRDSNFMSKIEQATASLPFMTAPGRKAGKDMNLYHYRHIFSMPGMAWPMPSNRMWYSFDVGPVHVVSYSTDVLFESDTQNAKAQQEWIVKDLTSANKNRAETPWVIAFGSHPMYCSFGNQDIDDCAQNTSKVRHGLEDMFYHFAVDLVIESRHTMYERSWPQYKGVVVSQSYQQPKAPVEVILGSKLEGQDVNKEDDSNFTLPTEAPLSAFHIPDMKTPSFGRLSVVNTTHLQWELISSLDKSTLDAFWIVQNSHGNFSLANLPHNVSHQINQTIIAMGGKPGTYDFISGSTGNASESEGLSKYSLWMGLTAVAGVLVLVLGLLGVRSCLRRRRAKAGRRWREMDRDGSTGGNFYSVASDSDTDDNDFEIDVYKKTNKQSSKLLTSY